MTYPFTLPTRLPEDPFPSNAWDAYAAKAFGMHVVWCNRFGQSPERIPDPPDGQIARLSELPAILGIR